MPCIRHWLVLGADASTTMQILHVQDVCCCNCLYSGCLPLFRLPSWGKCRLMSSMYGDINGRVCTTVSQRRPVVVFLHLAAGMWLDRVFARIQNNILQIDGVRNVFA
mgnify:CR=1 FL=1